MSHKSVDYKLAAIKDYLKYKNFSETSRRFNCSRTSLMRWVKKYNDTISHALNRQNNLLHKPPFNFICKIFIYKYYKYFNFVKNCGGFSLT